MNLNWLKEIDMLLNICVIILPSNLSSNKIIKSKLRSECLSSLFLSREEMKDSMLACAYTGGAQPFLAQGSHLIMI